MESRTLPAVSRSILLLFCVVLQLQFLTFILHEGGHALNALAHGVPIAAFYVHPFSFAGYALPSASWTDVLTDVWFHAMGTVVSLLVSLLIFVLLWKRRSVANLPLVILFPWNAIVAGVGVIYIPAQTGDYYNIMQLAGLPGAVFYAPGILLLLLGIFLFVSLLPLLGLAPRDPKSLYAIPAGLLLWSILSIPVAYLFVPGSPIDVQYQRGAEIIQTANGNLITVGIMGVLIAAICVGLYRWIYPDLPPWLRTETANLTWKDLRLPALLAASCVVIGLVVVA
jgi:hypothetical protein